MQHTVCTFNIICYRAIKNIGIVKVRTENQWGICSVFSLHCQLQPFLSCAFAIFTEISWSGEGNSIRSFRHGPLGKYAIKYFCRLGVWSRLLIYMQHNFLSSQISCGRCSESKIQHNYLNNGCIPHICTLRITCAGCLKYIGMLLPTAMEEHIFFSFELKVSPVSHLVVWVLMSL